MSVRAAYLARIASHEIKRDPAQERVIARLDALAKSLTVGRSFKNWLRQLLPIGAPPSPRGLYMWGKVGRGKTMLMDLFYSTLPADFPKRRVHFDAFMSDVHEQIFRHRIAAKAGRSKGEDPITYVADEIAKETSLLCFDEFAVTDIADAMILGRLFMQLLSRNITVVATSNTHPDRLYENGLNRPLFLPFIELIKQHMGVIELEACTDYRLEKISAGQIYSLGIGAKARARIDAVFTHLTGLAAAPPCSFSIKGHVFVVPQAAMGVARFSFAELCEMPLGSSDYLALAEAFHTVIIDDVPIFGPEQRHEVRRFITLIDILYDRGVKLVISAAAEPSELYQSPEGHEDVDFARAASRLVEMRSHAYLARQHNSAAKKPTVET